MYVHILYIKDMSTWYISLAPLSGISGISGQGVSKSTVYTVKYTRTQEESVSAVSCGL